MKKEDMLWYDRQRVMWFPFTFTKYWIKNGRFYSQKGFFNTKYDEVLLYRIVDISLTRTFLQKIFGTGTISLTTRADTERNIQIINITKPEETKDLLSQLIEEHRTNKNINGKEFLEINHDCDIDTNDLDVFND